MNKYNNMFVIQHTHFKIQLSESSLSAVSTILYQWLTMHSCMIFRDRQFSLSLIPYVLFLQFHNFRATVVFYYTIPIQGQQLVVSIKKNNDRNFICVAIYLFPQLAYTIIVIVNSTAKRFIQVECEAILTYIPIPME